MSTPTKLIYRISACSDDVDSDADDAVADDADDDVEADDVDADDVDADDVDADSVDEIDADADVVEWCTADNVVIGGASSPSPSPFSFLCADAIYRILPRTGSGRTPTMPSSTYS
ncbi:hypothetical protein [Lentzea fradiae]|uniref:hypothetical protein n=1 Tax=Lentzea fradiae TaxID=200378 RepID=UPI000B7E4E6A|nr:hypothetical protein [Lentzea fradiae]